VIRTPLRPEGKKVGRVSEAVDLADLSVPRFDAAMRFILAGGAPELVRPTCAHVENSPVRFILTALEHLSTGYGRFRVVRDPSIV